MLVINWFNFCDVLICCVGINFFVDLCLLIWILWFGFKELIRFIFRRYGFDFVVIGVLFIGLLDDLIFLVNVIIIEMIIGWIEIYLGFEVIFKNELFWGLKWFVNVLIFFRKVLLGIKIFMNKYLG